MLSSLFHVGSRDGKRVQTKALYKPTKVTDETPREMYLLEKDHHKEAYCVERGGDSTKGTYTADEAATDGFTFTEALESKTQLQSRQQVRKTNGGEIIPCVSGGSSHWKVRWAT